LEYQFDYGIMHLPVINLDMGIFTDREGFFTIMSSMAAIVPAEELNSRLAGLRSRMDLRCPDWELAVFISKINLYYFTGTMQEGMLLIPRNGDAVFWVRRSYERALEESMFPDIRQMDSYRDVTAPEGGFPAKVHLEMEILPMALFQRLQKYFPFMEAKPLDAQISALRSIKSSFELELLRKAGRMHIRVLEDRLPTIMREGMSEVELAAGLFSIMLEEGHHGLSRFGMFDTEIVLGHIGFGESSIYPAYFNGPGGNLGLSPAVPLMGNRERKLRKGDLIFIDVGVGYEGYHTDKTMTYVFGGSLSDKAVALHERCVGIQDKTAAMLKPGAVPSDIYRTVIDSLEPAFLENFMGFKNRRVRFLGHGIGLVIDEFPVIAEGFDEPLQEGMVIALEPKYGLEGTGLLGIENTFLVTPEGGICLTGESRGLISVY
jgi:Xaa-Pro dipeptidase